MRITLLLVWLLICSMIVVAICYVKFLSKYGKLLVVVLALCLFSFGGNIINLNTLSRDVQEKVNEVASICGKTYIKTSGSDVYVKVNNNWLNIKDIQIVGGMLSDDLVITYEGETIYLGHSGVVNTIKTMESLGLLDGK